MPTLINYMLCMHVFASKFVMQKLYFPGKTPNKSFTAYNVI